MDICHLPWAQHCPFPLGHLLFLSVPSVITPFQVFPPSNWLAFARTTRLPPGHPLSPEHQIWWIFQIFLKQSLVKSSFCSSTYSCLLPIVNQFRSKFSPLVFKSSYNHLIYPNLFPLHSHLTLVFFSKISFIVPDLWSSIICSLKSSSSPASQQLLSLRPPWALTSSTRLLRLPHGNLFLSYLLTWSLGSLNTGPILLISCSSVQQSKGAQ